MPKLPVLSGKDVVTALQRLGFVQTRQSGSHVVMRRGAVGCTVPMHRELKRGTLGAILTQAGITPDALIGALDR
jgi:predicted RNA binding protein YcfA (HicA-like mRNA interferase family)